jgi:hypothetical protein
VTQVTQMTKGPFDCRQAGRAGPRPAGRDAGRAAADHRVADGLLLDALSHAYDVLGFTATAGGDEVFFQLVTARIIEPVSKLDSLRVLEEAGLTPPPYRTVTRRLRAFAHEGWRQQISAACAAHARRGPASLRNAARIASVRSVIL